MGLLILKIHQQNSPSCTRPNGSHRSRRMVFFQRSLYPVRTEEERRKPNVRRTNRTLLPGKYPLTDAVSTRTRAPWGGKPDQRRRTEYPLPCAQAAVRVVPLRPPPSPLHGPKQPVLPSPLVRCSNAPAATPAAAGRAPSTAEPAEAAGWVLAAEGPVRATPAIRNVRVDARSCGIDLHKLAF